MGIVIFLVICAVFFGLVAMAPSRGRMPAGGAVAAVGRGSGGGSWCGSRR